MEHISDSKAEEFWIQWGMNTLDLTKNISQNHTQFIGRTWRTYVATRLFYVARSFFTYKPCGCLSAVQKLEPRGLEKCCSTQCPPLPYTSSCTSQWFLTLEMLLKHTVLPWHSSSLSSVFSSQDPGYRLLVQKLFLLFCLHVQSCPANCFMFLLFGCNQCQAPSPISSQFQLPGSLLISPEF